MTNAWIILLIAGLLETGWAIGIKFTDGFTRPLPSILTALSMIVSLYLLSRAAQHLPMGTAYPIWVGIGAVGAAVLGIVLLHEPVTAGRLFFLALLITSIIGLKITSA